MRVADGTGFVVHLRMFPGFCLKLERGSLIKVAGAENLKKLGLVVNPIAGMGGRVGLKGTDGPEILARARALGAEPVAPARAVRFLRALKELLPDVLLLTYPAEMGENEAREAGFGARVIGRIASGSTTSEDTKRAAQEMLAEKVDLLVFAGGDGTASDVLLAVDSKVPILGVPTGVKMHSAVFANTPEAAAQVAARFLQDGLPLREAEVMDIDEEAFREGRLTARLVGYALVPYEPSMVQATKEGSTGHELVDQKAIARWVVEMMERGCIYILGPGTTTRAVAEELGIYDSTLLGVDLIEDYRLLARDVNEAMILDAIKSKPAKILVSPIGRQGFILGRGNLQLSPRLLRRVGKNNLWVLATPQKLSITPTLRVDTGDPELDAEFRGYIKVITGYRQSKMVKVI
ncbi:MAG: ATP-NAD kinase family protein [Candidatus Hadarchaeum sp.]|uniref:ATP-NAD kinase family protein n=1 Tax=Candidatus Hadarchaeum sp. TaxID=2883567 RepID=UPI003D0DE9AA